MRPDFDDMFQENAAITAALGASAHSKIAFGQAAARRSYYVCGAYNVTVEAIEGALNDRMTINSDNGFEVLKEIKDDGESDIFQSAETGTNVWISGLRRYPLRQIIYGVTLTEFGGSEGGIVANCAVDPAHG